MIEPIDFTLDAVVYAMQAASSRIVDFGRAIADITNTFVAQASRAFAEFGWLLDPSFCETAYRAYVVRLNWKRGRGRKLSWRKLNRQQRADAIKFYYH